MKWHVQYKNFSWMNTEVIIWDPVNRACGNKLLGAL